MGTSSPPLPGLCPWTPLGTPIPQTHCYVPQPWRQIDAYARKFQNLEREKNCQFKNEIARIYIFIFCVLLLFFVIAVFR